MNRIAVTAHQIMPVGQRKTGIAKHISTGRWQPFEIAYFAARKPKAIRYKRPPVPVITTLRGLRVQQLTSDIGRVNTTSVLVLNLMQAAFAAAIAQRLPLRAVKRFQRGFPIWSIR